MNIECAKVGVSVHPTLATVTYECKMCMISSLFKMSKQNFFEEGGSKIGWFLLRSYARIFSLPNNSNAKINLGGLEVSYGFNFFDNVVGICENEFNETYS